MFQRTIVAEARSCKIKLDDWHMTNSDKENAINVFLGSLHNKHSF